MIALLIENGCQRSPGQYNEGLRPGTLRLLNFNSVDTDNRYFKPRSENSKQYP
jgi:hypothetical protein